LLYNTVMVRVVACTQPFLTNIEFGEISQMLKQMNIKDYMQTLGKDARMAARHIAAADTGKKNAVLRSIARVERMAYMPPCWIGLVLVTKV